MYFISINIIKTDLKFIDRNQRKKARNRSTCKALGLSTILNLIHQSRTQDDISYTTWLTSLIKKILLRNKKGFRNFRDGFPRMMNETEAFRNLGITVAQTPGIYDPRLKKVAIMKTFNVLISCHLQFWFLFCPLAEAKM